MNIDNLILKIQSLPSLLLGSIVICLVLIALYFIQPPITFCDIQMEAINETLKKGFYTDDKRGKYGKSVNHAFKHCLKSNSSGGCYDIFSRFKFFEKQIRTLPEECGPSPASSSIKKALKKALRLFAKIAWGDKPPENRYSKLSWLDTSDVGLYCQMKRHYRRLYGDEEWKIFSWSVIPTLPEVKSFKNNKKEMWNRSIFSVNCRKF